MQAAVEAAEWALLAMATRAVLARALASDPDVQSVAVSAGVDPNGGTTVVGEFRNSRGDALGGLEL